MDADAQRFLAALGAHLREDERLILCVVPGDPGKAEPGAWKPRPFHPELGTRYRFPLAWNGYVTVGAFGRAPDGTFRRRAANCTAGLALMIDDVGTKVPREAVAGVHPSARIETSPGNEQWWYLFDEPERDPVRFDAIIRAFIEGKLLGKDPGMAGVTRVGRLPGFQNCKPEYGGWEVRLLELNERRYSTRELLGEFDLKLAGRVEPPLWVRNGRIPPDVEERLAAFTQVEVFMRLNNMWKAPDYDPSGWREIHCPWVEEHTGGIDNGAAIREPNVENGFYGAFRCHHGSHANHGWRELTEWIAQQSAEQLEEGQAAAEAMFEQKLEEDNNERK